MKTDLRTTARLWGLVLTAVLVLGTHPCALAGAGTLSISVTPLTDGVTYSVNATTVPARPALLTYVGYTVTIKNAGGNTINNVLFTGAATVTDTDEKAVFSSAEGALCTTTSADLTAIQCPIGQLRAGQTFPTFAVFFKAPVKVTPLPDGALALCDTTDCAHFAGTTFYAEGTGGVPNSIPKNSTQPWSATAVPLGTSNAALIKSAVPKGGGSFFTGDGVATTPQDPFTTFVAVPAGPAFTTATLSESQDNVNCSNFLTCYKSDITIPGSFSPYLTIVVREDASNIKPGTNILSVVILYSNASIIDYPVGDCASPTTPLGNGFPCIAKRVDYKNKKVPGWTPELDGDFEWTLINTENGFIKIL